MTAGKRTQQRLRSLKRRCLGFLRVVQLPRLRFDPALAPARVPARRRAIRISPPLWKNHER
jgi:hypothetical protein